MARSPAHSPLLRLPWSARCTCSGGATGNGTVCFVASTGLVSGGASLLYWALLAWAGGFESATIWEITLIGLAAGIFYPLLNFAVVAPVAYLRRGIGVRTLWREGEKPFLPFHMFFLAISLGLIAIYHTYLPDTSGANSLNATLLVMLCLLPVIGLIYSFRAYSRQHDMAKRNARLAVRNERLALQAVVSLIYALDLKDNYTAQHSAAVAQWAGDIAEALGLDEYQVNLTHMASLLHDVGKIGVPEALLRSPEKLSAENWTEVEGHCQHGYKILRQIDQFDEPAAVVLHHHERYDGHGYPFGLSEERIPLASRIVSVADAYSAMISDRPYGPPLPAEIAQGELEFRKGTQFDPRVVDCFLDLLGRSSRAYVLGEEADFRLEVQAVKFLRDLPAEAEDDLGEERPQPAPVVARQRRRRTDREAASVEAAARQAEAPQVGAGMAVTVRETAGAVAVRDTRASRRHNGGDGGED